MTRLLGRYQVYSIQLHKIELTAILLHTEEVHPHRRTMQRQRRLQVGLQMVP